jgi:pyruvate/2-oxoglutarate dehydrogenase complex dihydrolipoamide acyltransferase (E2) component
MDIPAPVAGSVAEVLVKVGDRVSEGSAIVVLEPGDGALSPPPSLVQQQEPAPEVTEDVVSAAAARAPAMAHPPTLADAHAGPGVRRLAHELDIDLRPRLLLPLSLSYDHRVIDGALAGRFTRHLCTVVEDVRRLLL